MIGALAGAVVALVLLSALLSAAEAATFSVGESRLRTLSEEGFHGAADLQALREDPGRLRDGVRLLASLLDLVAVGLSVRLGSVVLEAGGWWLGLSGGVAAVILAGYSLPRALARRWPIRLALGSAPQLMRLHRWLRLALSPLLRLESYVAGRGDGVDVNDDEREVRELAELGSEAGVVDADERLLVERAFRLDERSAWDVMTPRVDIFAWSDALQLRDIVEELAQVPYSRVPVYGESVDDVTGIVYVREAYSAFAAGRVDVPLSRLAREPFFVPGSVSLARLLRDFQARRIHMGIVADEFGGIDGLVTLEDVLEELVGEIVDETDVDQQPLVRIGKGEWAAAGSVDVREITDALMLPVPRVEPRSLNGLILEELGYVPEAGEAIERDGLRIEILESSDTQVLRARLRRVTSARERGGEPREADA